MQTIYPYDQNPFKESHVQTMYQAPNASPKVFVDDTSVSARHKRWSTVLNRLAPSIIDFAEGVNSLELSVSSKVMLIASHPKLASLLKHEFSTYNIQFQIPSAREGARDLGISNTAGIHRPNMVSLLP